MKQSPHVLALDRASEICGGITKLALALGVGQSVVSNWKARRTLIDAAYCTAIERLTAGQVTRRDLRPNDWQAIWPELADPYPIPPAQPSQPAQAGA